LGLFLPSLDEMSVTTIHMTQSSHSIRRQLQKKTLCK
jgi:hypothetical protein